MVIWQRLLRGNRCAGATTIGAYVILVCAMGLVGCGTSAPGSGTGSGTVSLKELNPAAGIDYAHASYGIWGDGMAFVILTDIVGGRSGGGGGRGTFQPHRYRGYQKSGDGRQVQWQGETSDGKTGTVTVNGQPYDLAQGSLFVVSTKGGQTQVLQLKRDTLKLKAGQQEGLDSLVKDDSDIGSFFAGAAKPK